MIEVQNVTKRYGTTVAVDNLSFKVEPGQILGFLGPNGAGKTTTMRVLTGYMPPTEGKAIVAGFDVFDNPVEAKRRTGYLPESPPLYPDMTVREYLQFVARINDIERTDRQSRIEQTMGRTSIEDVADRHCGKLSKGYRQRVGLAQAILHNPDVLILDEPTAGLDPNQIIGTRELIRSLSGDHTIILSTHILPEVAQTCERVVIINKGRVVAEDTPENLTGGLEASTTINIEIDTFGVDPTATLETISGVVSAKSNSDDNAQTCSVEVKTSKGTDARRDLAHTIVSKGWGLLEMTSAKRSLEETFLDLTTSEDSEDSFNSVAETTENVS